MNFDKSRYENIFFSRDLAANARTNTKSNAKCMHRNIRKDEK